MSRATEERNLRMLRARDAMDRAYAQPLDIPSLARIAHVAEAHFIRTFSATFGETPHRYLQRRRVERSMFLLRETDRSVTDVCFDVGFNSLGTFSLLPRDRRRIARRLPQARRRQSRALLLRHGLDPAEQFWRSAQARRRLNWPTCSTK
jgi:AraC-like DNA-binding protein